MAEACGGKGLNQSVALARSGAQSASCERCWSGRGMLLDVLKASVLGRYKSLSELAVSGDQVDQNGQNNIIICGVEAIPYRSEMIDEAVKEWKREISSSPERDLQMGYAAEIRRRRRPGAKVALNPSPINENLKTIPMNLVDYLFLTRSREKRFPERVRNRKRSWRS